MPRTSSITLEKIEDVSILASEKKIKTDWTGLVAVKDFPAALQRGEHVLCEWEDGVYYRARVVNQRKRNHVVLTFDEDAVKHKYVVWFRGNRGHITPTNRPRKLYYNPGNLSSIF